MSWPLSGRTILLTRVPAENAPLAAELATLGAQVVELPLLKVVPPADDGAALSAAVAKLSDYAFVVFTSANGVRAFVDAREIPGESWPTDLSVVAVGPATAAAATAAGLAVDVMASTATAAALTDALPAAGDDASRVLAPLAEQASPTVVDGLTAKGYAVDRVTAYQTVSPPLPDKLPAVDAIALFAPSAVDRFVDRYGVGALPPVVVAIGPSTMTRLADLGVGGAAEATPHTSAGVLDMLVFTLQRSPEQGRSTMGG